MGKLHTPLVRIYDIGFLRYPLFFPAPPLPGYIVYSATLPPLFVVSSLLRSWFHLAVPAPPRDKSSLRVLFFEREQEEEHIAAPPPLFTQP